MGIKNKHFLQAIRRRSKGKRLTDSVATLSLSRYLYLGHGATYLSLPVCEDGVGRPIDSTPRHFRCPRSGQDYARWLPFKNHVTGDFKGLVADQNTKSVPFIAVDIDRHSGTVHSETHQRIVLEIGRRLRKINQIKWLAEVNPRNGSAKFFGFRRSGLNFRIDDAREMAAKIRQSLIKENLCHNGNVEVFPDNCKAIFLPLRRDKISVADTGVLPRCYRKVRDYRYFPQRVMEKIQCYSALHFLNWIYQGENYEETALVSALRHSCAGLPDQPTSASYRDVSRAMSEASEARPPRGGGPAINRSKSEFDYSKIEVSNPCAFSRNWDVLLTFARQFYKVNNRLPETDEALEYLRHNGLFSGRWSDNTSRRRQRVSGILRTIERTFDPSKISGNTKFVFDAGIQRWCRRHFSSGLKHQIRKINEYEMTSYIHSFKVPASFVDHCVGIIAFCLNAPLEDKALPVDRIKSLWKLFPGNPSWNQKYFEAVRWKLEDIKVIDIFDKTHRPGKAWRWDKGVNFPSKQKSSRRRSSRKTESSVGRPNTAGVREWEIKGKEKKKLHNTLYHPVLAILRDGANKTIIRPPPSLKS